MPAYVPLYWEYPTDAVNTVSMLAQGDGVTSRVAC
jgi:hypothetical protein